MLLRILSCPAKTKNTLDTFDAMHPVACCLSARGRSTWDRTWAAWAAHASGAGAGHFYFYFSLFFFSAIFWPGTLEALRKHGAWRWGNYPTPYVSPMVSWVREEREDGTTWLSVRALHGMAWHGTAWHFLSWRIDIIYGRGGSGLRVGHDKVRSVR